MTPLLLQRPPVMGHELPLPTPGMPPRSIEGEAERLAARVLAQTGVSKGLLVQLQNQTPLRVLGAF